MTIEQCLNILKNKWTLSDIEMFNSYTYNDDGNVNINFVDYCVEKGYYDEND